jgi:hypothetical protein
MTYITDPGAVMKPVPGSEDPALFRGLPAKNGRP